MKNDYAMLVSHKGILTRGMTTDNIWERDFTLFCGGIRHQFTGVIIDLLMYTSIV